MFVQSKGSDEWKKCSDEELWVEYRHDNKEAFSALFSHCYERLFHYGMQFASREAAVSDGIQTLFLRLWERRKKLACPRSVIGYLYVSLRRILLRRGKRKKAREQRHTDFTNLKTPYMRSIEEQIICQEEEAKRRALLQFALQELTPRQKEALLLRIDSGMSNAEIADMMNVSGKRVRNLIYAATKRLKEEVSRPTGQSE